MKIRSKSPNELNAQAMTFVTNETQNGLEREQLYAMATKNLGEIVLHDAYPSYVSSLKNARSREVVAKRTELQNRYTTDFAPVVTQLKASIEAYSVDSHESYIASGTQANVFGFTQDNKEYVARTLRSGVSDPVKIDSYVAATLSVQGIPHFEQIVAASYEDEVTVAERMPGRDMSRVTNDEVTAITDEQIGEFLSTLKIAYDKGLDLDNIPQNVMYDQDEGFGLIDFAPPVPGIRQAGGYGDILARYADTFRQVGDKSQAYNKATSRDKQEYYDEKLNSIKARKSLLEKYARQIAKLPMADEERGYALSRIHASIDLLGQEENEFEDTQWVSKEMKRASEYYAEARKVGEAALGAANDWRADNATSGASWEAPAPTMVF